jgi:hypothetical protein
MVTFHFETKDGRTITYNLANDAVAAARRAVSRSGGSRTITVKKNGSCLGFANVYERANGEVVVDVMSMKAALYI